MKTRYLAAALLSLLIPRQALAWGERGHHAAARSAALSVLAGLDLSTLAPEEAEAYRSLESFFRRKAIQLGHLSNIPDTAWRSLDSEASAQNGPTHFADADQWTDDFDAIPLDYPTALQKFHGKPNRIDRKPIDLFESGTSIWRSQELYDLTVEQWETVKTSTPGSPEQKTAAQKAVVYSGLLAHFIGDASMPYHNATDYDGYGTGNGGVHSFFETEIPEVETPDFEADIHRKIPERWIRLDIDGAFQKGGTRPAAFLCRELGKLAFARIQDLRRIDDSFITRRSSPPAAGQRGSAAQRRPPEAAAPAFRPMITEQVAGSAAALARLWRGAWEAAGKPDLAKARGWDYAHKPDFVAPGYDPDALGRIRERLQNAKKP